MVMQYITIGVGVAVALNLTTLAIALFLYYDPSDKIDWGMVTTRALIAATLGGWFGAMIAAVTLILR